MLNAFHTGDLAVFGYCKNPLFTCVLIIVGIDSLQRNDVPGSHLQITIRKLRQKESHRPVIFRTNLDHVQRNYRYVYRKEG